MKLRLEKFKNEQAAQYAKEIQEKASEIEVLKEMVKSSQVTIKAKEREMLRYKQQKGINQEALANIVQKLQVQGTPGQRNLNLSQIKNTPQRYKPLMPAQINYLPDINNAHLGLSESK